MKTLKRIGIDGIHEYPYEQLLSLLPYLPYPANFICFDRRIYEAKIIISIFF